MLLAIPPGALVVAFRDHVDALDDVAVGVVLEGDDALEAKMFGPSSCVTFSIHGKKRFGSISAPRSDTDCTVTSWIGDIAPWP